MNKYLGDYIPRKTEISENLTGLHDFNKVGVELFKEIAIPIRIISSSKRVNPQTGEFIEYEKETAVIIGSFVRYGKLTSSLLEQFTQTRAENAIIFFRCLAETFINLKYFLKYSDDFTIKHFIKHSLQTEKEMLEIIRKNVSDKEQMSHIEKRMTKSINQAFDETDFDFDELNKSTKWNKKVKSRISDILHPEAYSFIYGAGSQAIHGNWQDLVSFHLEKGENGYFPKTEWTVPQIQILTSATIMSCDILKEYLEFFIPNDNERSELFKLIQDISNRCEKLVEIHENYLKEKK
jgi:hypothetical protein